ncbi:MAG: hypothetical protein R3230_01015 [Nitrosopumilaceae archaeon]|nr:hypothetical protein [Nitrosopumilaceae archaeon]
MDINEYQKQAERTAPKFPMDLRVDEKIINALKYTIGNFVSVGNTLDDIKKHIYYGKQFDWIDQLNQAIPERNIQRYTQKHADIIHAIIGIATEASEMLEALYKMLETGDLDEVNAIEENGDVMWYQALLLRALESSFEQSGSINIEKLYERFPDKFDNDKAIYRDVKKERELLEARVNETTNPLH